MTQQRKTIAHRRRSRPVRDFFAAALDARAAALDLKATEANYGIDLIEATAADKFQRDMEQIGNSPEARQKLRDTAIALAQLGISGYEDVQKMVQGYYVMDVYDLSLMDVRKIGEIKVGGRRI